jgi:2-dehydro-3-deoxyphosphogluconate aldolase / (4S)-4-hydroxy-2-oxoglutarate aldolase
LSSLASPLPQVKFCPTGGITPETAPSYLKLSNVITIGGSWMAPKAMVQAGDWAGIEALAKIASTLK